MESNAKAKGNLIEWIETQVGSSLGKSQDPSDVMDWLADGKVLCHLANSMMADSNKALKISTAKNSTVFQAREHVTAFLQWYEKVYQVDSKKDLFTFTDLFENKDEAKVLPCLRLLKDLSSIGRWIEHVVKEDQQGELTEWLRNGRVLCILANQLEQKNVIKIKADKTTFNTFQALENISMFLKWCRDTAGIPDSELFTPVQLYEDHDEKSVTRCIRAVQKKFGASVEEVKPRKGSASPQKQLENLRNSISADVPSPEKSPMASPAKLRSSLNGNYFLSKETSLAADEVNVVEARKPSSPRSKLDPSLLAAFGKQVESDTDPATSSSFGALVTDDRKALEENPSKFAAFVQLTPRNAAQPHSKVSTNGEGLSKLASFLQSVPPPPPRSMSTEEFADDSATALSPVYEMEESEDDSEEECNVLTGNKDEKIEDEPGHENTLKAKERLFLTDSARKESRSASDKVDDVYTLTPPKNADVILQQPKRQGSMSKLMSFLTATSTIEPTVVGKTATDVSGHEKAGNVTDVGEREPSIRPSSIPSPIRQKIEYIEKADASASKTPRPSPSKKRMEAFQAAFNTYETGEKQPKTCTSVELLPIPKEATEKIKTHSDQDGPDALKKPWFSSTPSQSVAEESDSLLSPRTLRFQLKQARVQMEELKMAVSQRDEHPLCVSIQTLKDQLEAQKKEKESLVKEMEQAKKDLAQQMENQIEELAQSEQASRQSLRRGWEAKCEKLQDLLRATKQQHEEEKENLSHRIEDLDLLLRQREEEVLRMGKELDEFKTEKLFVQARAQQSVDEKEQERLALLDTFHALKQRYERLENEHEHQVALARGDEEAARFSAQQALLAQEELKAEVLRKDNLLNLFLQQKDVDWKEKIDALVNDRLVELRRKRGEREGRPTWDDEVDDLKARALPLDMLKEWKSNDLLMSKDFASRTFGFPHECKLVTIETEGPLGMELDIDHFVGLPRVQKIKATSVLRGMDGPRTIQEGFLLEEIDGKPTKFMPFADVKKLLKECPRPFTCKFVVPTERESS